MTMPYIHTTESANSRFLPNERPLFHLYRMANDRHDVIKAGKELSIATEGSKQLVKLFMQTPRYFTASVTGITEPFNFNAMCEG